MELMLAAIVVTLIVGAIVFSVARSTFTRTPSNHQASRVTSLDAVREHGREVAVAGESYDNDDGTPRRDIIARLKVGDMVALEREPRNEHDENAVVVRSLKGVIGYVSREDDGEIASWLDDGDRVAAYITAIAGGPGQGKADYGVWLHAISLEKLAEEKDT